MTEWLFILVLWSDRGGYQPVSVEMENRAACIAAVNSNLTDFSSRCISRKTGEIIKLIPPSLGFGFQQIPSHYYGNLAPTNNLCVGASTCGAEKAK